MLLEIITPEKQLYQGEIEQVNLPGSSGSFEILKNHAPIVSTLSSGNIVLIDTQGKSETFLIKGGVVEQSDNKVTILAEY